ncbi:MarR family transcriptional regulator [Veillonella rodentium]|uniref:MarR family n=1 Tax=Veillonella rodentium TaxID=248315 RepID=A0A239ZNY8_9FIRM|nr:MarR family transcriptional regulator [Veillonella rodentium]SNV72493.1 MarR family [Veillonella rodentium]
MKSKQGGFLVHKIKYLNTRLFNRLLQADTRALFNGEQGKILSVLWDEGERTASDIADITGLANSTLSIMLKRMEQQGLIIGYDDCNDKRKRIYGVSALGREQQVVGNEISDALSDIFYDGFSDVEIKEFESYLERILDNLKSEYYK